MQIRPVAIACLWAGILAAQSSVTSERLLNASKEPQNWLIYDGDYSSHRYSGLTQITPANAKNLTLSWVYQSPVAGSWQAMPDQLRHKSGHLKNAPGRNEAMEKSLASGVRFAASGRKLRLTNFFHSTVEKMV